MPWVEPVTTAVTAAKLAHKLAESSSWIGRHASRIWYWVNNGSAVIPVMGAGGVGKSTVGAVVSSTDPLRVIAAYDPSWLVEEKKLTGDIPGRLLVAPGQDDKVDLHWPDVLAKVKDGTSFGVINVVCYGYHALGINSFREHDVYKALKDERDMQAVKEEIDEQAFMQAYLPNRRELEVVRLKTLLGCIETLKRPFWMITLVTKQDLWWSERAKVRDHYEKGQYGTLIRQLIESGRVQKFQHEFLPVSLVVGNLKTPNNEMLALTTSGYDSVLHVSHLESFFAKFHQMIAQGML